MRAQNVVDLKEKGGNIFFKAGGWNNAELTFQNKAI